MNIAVVGSRNIKSESQIFAELDKYEISCIVSGGAKGVDTIAEKYAQANNIPTKIFKPEYDKYHFKQAPLMRNLQIVESSDTVIAFWDGKSKGTLFTINEAKKRNIPVVVVISA